jgi:hypothetical protein
VLGLQFVYAVAHQQNQNYVYGNITSAFVQAYTNKKVYAVAGLQFGLELVGKIVIIWNALYRLVFSSKR